MIFILFLCVLLPLNSMDPINNQNQENLTLSKKLKNKERLKLSRELFKKCSKNYNIEDNNKDNIIAIQNLIKNKADVNAMEIKSGMTPLHKACAAPNNLNIKSGMTPLHKACEAPNNLNLEVIKLLVENGANVNASNANGETPIFFSCKQNNNLEVIKFLTESKSNVNTQDINGETPIFFACEKDDNLEVIKFLTESKSNVMHQGKNQEGKNQKGLLHLILLYNPFDKKNPDPYNYISHLIVTNQRNCSYYDYEYYPEFRIVNQRDRTQRTPLHTACDLMGDMEIIKLLIEKKSDLEAKTEEDQETPLLIASRKKSNSDTIKYLIEKKSDLNTKNKFGRNALHLQLIANPESTDIIKHMIDQNNVNQQDNEGMTPLHFACLNKSNIETIHYLIKNKANVELRDSQDKMPLERLEGNSSGIIKLLAQDINQKNDLGESPLHLACSCETQDIETIKYLIENKANVNMTDNEGQTPLHLACLHGKDNAITIQYLIENNADVKLIDGFKRTPLHRACSNKKPNLKVLSCLIKGGVDIDAKDNLNQTALHNACSHGVTPEDRKSNEDTQWDRIDYLITQNADVNAKNNGGEVPNLPDSLKHRQKKANYWGFKIF